MWTGSEKTSATRTELEEKARRRRLKGTMEKLRELRQLAEKLTDKNRAGTGQSSSERKKKLEMLLHAIKCTANRNEMQLVHMDQSTDAETP